MKTIIPKNKKNPVSTTRILRPAFKETDRRFRLINKRILNLFERVPRGTIDADTGQAVNSEVIYRYAIDAYQLQSLNAQMMAIIREGLQNEFLEWYLWDYTSRSYAQGTAQSVLNLQSIGGARYSKTIESVLSSQAYRDRIAFTQARLFEEMEKLTVDMRTDLARTLGQGMAAGDGPVNIAKRITKRIGVSKSSALRIARTEINQAHRRARWEEAQATSEMGIHTRMLHLSALKPTTRTNHARRHGLTYTRQEVEDWYQIGANAINCYCTQVEVLVDSKGIPIDKNLIRRTREDGKAYFETYGTGQKRAA